MPLTRRALVASALALPVAARAQPQGREPMVLDLRPGTQRLVPEPAGETQVWAANGQVPGPVIRVKKGDEVFVRVMNNLEQPTALHWQGVRIRNEMDGVPGLTQQAIVPGASFDYRFTVPDAGTYWYRPSAWPNAAEQKGRGVYGLLIVDDPDAQPVDREIVAVLDDWRLDEAGQIQGPFLDPADVAGEGRTGPLVTINSHPAPQTIGVPPGARVKLRLLNACSARLAGIIFEDLRPYVVGIDGQSCDPFEPARKTIPAGPGARFDVVFDVPTDRDAKPAISLRGGGLRSESGGEPDRKLIAFSLEGEALPARPAVSSRQNPALPPEIKLQNAKRLDLTIEAAAAGADPRKAWMLNGVASNGATTPALFQAKRGQPVTLGFINKSKVAHTMHVHGHAFRILHLLDDGWEPYWRDSVIVPPGRTVRIAFLADNPGKWLVESTILDHAMSGLAAWFEVN